MQWAEQLYSYRHLYYKKLNAVKMFKTQMLKKQAEMQTLVNLRWATGSSHEKRNEEQIQPDPAEQLFTKDKELRDLITQDVERTMQEVALFTKPEVKGCLENLLYLWAKDNAEFGYRQGMNEVLALLVVAFF